MAQPSTLTVIPKLSELLEHPEKVSALPLEAVPVMRGKLAELDTLLQMRVAMAQSNGQDRTHADGDRLLDAKETARRMGVSLDYIYKHAEEFPFAVKEGRRVLFSERSLEQYLRGKMKKKGLDL